MGNLPVSYRDSPQDQVPSSRDPGFFPVPTPARPHLYSSLCPGRWEGCWEPLLPLPGSVTKSLKSSPAPQVSGLAQCS